MIYCCKKLEDGFKEDDYNFVIGYDGKMRLLHKEGYEDFWNIRDQCPFCGSQIAR